MAVQVPDLRRVVAGIVVKLRPGWMDPARAGRDRADGLAAASLLPLSVRMTPMPGLAHRIAALAPRLRLPPVMMTMLISRSFDGMSKS